MTPHQQFERQFRKPREGRTLIVGSHVYAGREDRRGMYAQAVGIDAVAGPGVDLALNLEEALPEDLGQFDHVECRSVLEHSRRPWLLAENIERLLVLGGTLDLSVPFVWSLHAYPSDLYRFSADGVVALFPRIRWAALRYAGATLTEGGKTPRAEIDGHIYIARTEVLGWGVR
jgi:SAM-dependent methyltransferase